MAKDKYEPTEGTTKDLAGKGELDDEMLPNKGEPMRQGEGGGNEYDTAGEHGDLAPETAKPIADKAEKYEKEKEKS